MLWWAGTVVYACRCAEAEAVVPVLSHVPGTALSCLKWIAA
jgi:hypothetical protein